MLVYYCTGNKGKPTFAWKNCIFDSEACWIFVHTQVTTLHVCFRVSAIRKAVLVLSI